MITIHKADDASPQDKRGKYFMRYHHEDGAGPEVECPAPLQAALANAEKLAMDARDNAQEADARVGGVALQQLQPDLRELERELLDDRRQHVARLGVRRGEAQRPLRAAGVVTRASLGCRPRA